ncbi:MAG TPA: sigma-54 dependent transcriptional regulator [Polyangiaceae bacterium]|jgi:DNA-binding NtrC family response regulator|nr:sigma-54 dependent transcriptional regulator [Polyangiaceae bacterium]
MTAVMQKGSQASQKRVLVVDDERIMCDVLVEELGRRGLAAFAETSPVEALGRIANESFDAVITDLNMRGMNGVDLCDRIVKNRPEVPVVVITAFGTMESAVATLRAGAVDFLTKPFDMDQLARTVERAIQTRELREEVKRLRKAVDASRRFEDLLGASQPMQRLYDLLDRVATVDTHVLLTGEIGTGKELTARAIHKRSRRADGPLVVMRCAAIAEPLMESALLGIAGEPLIGRRAGPGLLAAAHMGTLFIDELDALPLAIQAKLLDALEARAVRPIGGADEQPADVRVIASTNRDLQAAVEEGRFREDLYYRVNVVSIELPPLRVRGNDILLLAQAFATRFADQHEKGVSRISPAVAERLLSYTWPGNIRELRNCVERAVALARFEEIRVDDLPAHISDFRASQVLVASNDPSELVPLAEIEKRYIERVLEAVSGNKRRAARILGLDRATLYRKLERLAGGGSSASGKGESTSSG